MAQIEGRILIGRPVEAVFDFVADQRNEPQYNPRMVRAAKITGGPVGKGTVFQSATKSMGRTAEMRIELTGYDRPSRLASRTIIRQAEMDGTLTFEPAPSGTRMRWAWQVRPKGAVRRADGIGDADRHTEGDAGARVAKAQCQRSAGSCSSEHS